MCSATNAFGLLNAPSGWWYANTRPSRRRRRSTTWFASPISTDTPLLRPSRLNAVRPRRRRRDRPRRRSVALRRRSDLAQEALARARRRGAPLPVRVDRPRVHQRDVHAARPARGEKCTASSPSASSPEASSATASRRRGIARLIDSSAIGNSAIAPVVVPSSRRWYESAGRCASVVRARHERRSTAFRRAPGTGTASGSVSGEKGRRRRGADASSRRRSFRRPREFEAEARTSRAGPRPSRRASRRTSSRPRRRGTKAPAKASRAHREPPTSSPRDEPAGGWFVTARTPDRRLERAPRLRYCPGRARRRTRRRGGASRGRRDRRRESETRTERRT